VHDFLEQLCTVAESLQLIYPEHNIHLAFLDLHSLDQGPDNVALAVPVGLIQPILDFQGEVFQATDNQLQLGLQLGVIGEFSRLLLQFRYAFSQPRDPWFKLSFINQTLSITIDDPSRPLSQLIQLRLDPGKIMVVCLCLRLQTATIFFCQPVWAFQQSSHFLPYCQVQQVGSHLQIVTYSLATKAIGVCPETAVSGKQWIGADVRLAPGNSGGMLTDAEGHVVGINSMIDNGLALVVPSNAAKRFLARDARPQLGIKIRALHMTRDGSDTLGLLVFDIQSGSGAEKSGIMIGDAIVGTRERLFTNANDLATSLEDAAASNLEILELSLIRGGKKIHWPAPESRPVWGMSINSLQFNSVGLLESVSDQPLFS